MHPTLLATIGHVAHPSWRSDVEAAAQGPAAAPLRTLVQMESLAAHAGSWVGTCGFRMMPTDPFHEATATAEVTTAAGGSLVVVAYTWSHPEEGRCEGLLDVGPGEMPGTASALWADSFHQNPAPALPTGTVEDGLLTLSYDDAAGVRAIVAAHR